MSPARSVTLLQLSDMQFGAKHRFESGAPGSLLSRLREDFEEMQQRHGLMPDIILVTGDLVETGKPSEFKQFMRFAEALVEGFDLPRRRLVMIPGNHDINWAACEGYFKDCEADERAPQRPYWPKLRHYAAMFAEFYANEPDLTFTEEAPYTLFDYPELGVVVAGLDSTIADSHRADDHYGFLGEEQLKHFAGKLRMLQDQGFVRIAAVHHDPTHPEAEAARQDLKDLKRILAPYLNLVVHGHTHEDELNWLDNTIPILGVGSAGVQAAQRPAEVPNQYQWIRIFADRIEYGSRAYVPDQKRWVGDLRPDRAGERWWQHKRVAFDRVSALSAPSARDATHSPEAERARTVASYRTSLHRQLRRRPLVCDIATYGEDSDLVQGLDLLTIFVPQRAIQEVPRSDRPARLGGSPHGVLDGSEPAAEFGPGAMTAALPIDSIVTSPDHPWTLVLGTPGAGKTTLTLWLALKLSADGERLPSLSTAFIPVRIELRLFAERWSAARKSGRSYDFFDYVGDVHREESRPMGTDMLRAVAEEGLVLWLFDGLDEVAVDEQRRTIADMIVGVRETYQGRGIITGRLVGCRPLRSRFHDAEVHCFTLLDFEEPQIEQFLTHWHTLAFPNAADLGARRLERLRQTLASNAALRDLRGNPLLLTLIALLNRGDELPRRRHELLERAAVLMLSQWETNKGLPAGDTTQFDLVDKRRFLAELAWHMLTEVPGGAGNVIEVDALRRFTEQFWIRRLAADAPRASSTAQALIEHLRTRNYVLGLLGGQSFGFLHKAFMEFFAAEEVCHRYRSHQWRLEDVGEVFQKHWWDPSWREVLTLTCGMLQEDRPETVVSLLQHVLSEGPEVTALEHLEFGTFAIRCLAEVRGLKSGVPQEFALGLNQYLWSALRRQQDLDGIQFVFADNSPERAFGSSVGVWPGLADMVSHVRTAARPLSWLCNEGLLTFAAAMEPELRFSLFCDLIDAWQIGPSFFPKAIAAGTWGISDAEKLEARLESATQRHLGEALVLAQCEETQGRVRPSPAVLGCITSTVGAEALELFAQVPMVANTTAWTDWRLILARLGQRLLMVAPPEYICLEVLPVFALVRITPSPDEMRAIRGAAEIGESSWSRDLLIWILNDELYLRHWLRSKGGDRTALFNFSARFMGQWSRGVEVFEDWTRSLEDVNEGARLRRIFAFLGSIRRRDALGIAAGVPLAVAPGGEPDWPLLDHFRAALEVSSVAELKATLRVVSDTFVGRAAEVGLHLISGLATYGSDGDKFFEEEEVDVIFMELLDVAAEKCPWVGLYYSASLPTIHSDWLETIQTPEFSGRLIEASSRAQFGLREPELLEAARTARALQLPWEPPLRHLLEHGKDGRLRVLAARELGDWAALARLAREGTEPEQRAAQLVIEIRDIRGHLLRIGKPRRGLVLRRGVRVGTIDELAGGGTRFTYQREYLAKKGARPIAPNLPLRAEPYDSSGLHPVFEGLLPQGWLLDIDLERYRLKPSDQFGLLLATGRDTIGAIEILPERD